MHHCNCQRENVTDSKMIIVQQFSWRVAALQFSENVTDRQCYHKVSKSQEAQSRCTIVRECKRLMQQVPAQCASTQALFTNAIARENVIYFILGQKISIKCDETQKCHKQDKTSIPVQFKPVPIWRQCTAVANRNCSWQNLRGIDLSGWVFKIYNCDLHPHTLMSINNLQNCILILIPIFSVLIFWTPPDTSYGQHGVTNLEIVCVKGLFSVHTHTHTHTYLVGSTYTLPKHSLDIWK